MNLRQLSVAVGLAACCVMAVDLAAEDRLGAEAESSDVPSDAVPHPDPMRDMQKQSVVTGKSIYGHWGADQSKFSSWNEHSNRLVPVYTFGISLSNLREEGSVYCDQRRLSVLSDQSKGTSANPVATYYDQTDIYRLQKQAIDAGYSNIILILFDGMDWQTTRAAALYKTGRDDYRSGRGAGLAFQDDRRTITDYGLLCTSSACDGAEVDSNSQCVLSVSTNQQHGFDAMLGGRTPWNEKLSSPYLLGEDRTRPHTVTDSAASATGMCSGVKTFNGAINVDLEGNHLLPIARELQRDQDFMVGVVSSVPGSHATAAAAYANNVSRKDYQDISRDMLGLPSASHRSEPLDGVDVLIGAGWGEQKESDVLQGDNFAQGNRYLHESDLRACDLRNGGRYRVAQRTAGKSGRDSLMHAAQAAADNGDRLLGFYGVTGGHLPYATADGNFDPTIDSRDAEVYSRADIAENPTLADMTEAALRVLEQSIDGFWLMIEAGDVDWANHANNLDNSIGAVLSGEQAFVKVMDWVDENAAWDHTAVIVTADHGHYLVVDNPEAIAKAGRLTGK